MRKLQWHLFLFLVLAFLRPGEAAGVTREFIFVSGGPAIRFYEKGKASSHDKYWGNFVDSAVPRFQQIKDTLRDGDQLTWLVYRQGYVQRGEEMQTNLLLPIEAKAKAIGAVLLWFDNTNQLINYLNKGMDRSQVKIWNFDYFGHSNKACFLFDYSNEIDGMSITTLHVRDLKRINRDIFASEATCKSWGCHSGEYYSEKWRNGFGVPMEGAIGKTDYSNGGLPFLSSDVGRWVK